MLQYCLIQVFQSVITTQNSQKSKAHISLESQIAHLRFLQKFQEFSWFMGWELRIETCCSYSLPVQIQVPIFVIILWFLLWVPQTSKVTCREESSPASAYHHHTTNFGGDFWPTQWALVVPIGFSQPPSYQGTRIDHLFDLDLSGPHLESNLKFVPICVHFQFVQSAYLITYSLFVVHVCFFWLICDY